MRRLGMINSCWLEALRLLSNCASFTVAARNLGITQSALSQRINHLEEAVGAPLVVRSRPLRLTLVGERLLQYAEAAQLLQAEVDIELRETSVLSAGSQAV